MGDDELSPAEKLKLAQNFILNSPPGQVQKVAQGVQTLIGPSLDQSSLAKMMAKVNADQFLKVEVPGSGDGVLLTPAGLLPDGTFLDPTSPQKLTIDHRKQCCTGVAPLSQAEHAEAEPTRKKVADAMNSYAAECLPDATVTTYGKAVGGGIQVTCCVGSCSMNLGSYWSGLWRSEWTLTMSSAGSSKGELTGKIKCHVHYFEDGNVQLNDSTDFKSDLDLGSDAGEAFAKKVRELELKFTSSMETIYQTMNEQVLNALRRRLPITKVKFDWDNRASIHKLATELNAFKAS